MLRRMQWLAFLVLLIVLGGCSEDEENPFRPETDDNVPDSALPFPATPDQVMANFREIYEALDTVEYGLILDPAFETHLQPATVSEFPALGATLDFTEETRIHDRMFSGDDLTNAEGDLLPGIAGFDFGVFRKVVDWGESLPTDPIPNTLSALYEVDLVVDRGQSYSTIRLSGGIRFYVEPAVGRVAGEARTYYRLIGQLDQTGSGKGTEETTWGSLKALYH